MSGRKPVPRQLPPLRDVAGAIHGFAPQESKTAGLEKWLRQIATRALADLLQRARVAVGRPVMLSPAYLGDARVDYLNQDWAQIAQQVAADMDSGRVFTQLQPTVIETIWRPQIPAAATSPNLAPLGEIPLS